MVLDSYTQAGHSWVSTNKELVAKEAREVQRASFRADPCT